MLATTKALEMKPTFLSLISTHEDPYIHLSTFYELVGTRVRWSLLWSTREIQSDVEKIPNHRFEDIVQLNIFCNGLRYDTKILLDTTTGGTMMIVDVEQATKIMDALAWTDYQA